MTPNQGDTKVQVSFFRRGLEQFNRHEVSIRDTAPLFSSLEIFQRELLQATTVDDVLSTASQYISGMNIFLACGFYMANPGTYQFELSHSIPHERERILSRFIKQEIAAGRFAWALRQNRPVFVNIENVKGSEQAVLFSVATRNRTLGMFLGLLSEPDSAYRAALMSLFSVMIANTSHALDNLMMQNELLNQNEQLREAKDRAERADQAKADFLAMMSHEIRTPMNSIVGFADALGIANLTDQQRSLVNKITSGSEMLLSVINDILDYSKLGSDAFRLNLNPCDPAKEISSIIEMLSPQAADRKNKLEHTVSQDFPKRVITDAARLKQIFTNLLVNAIKFTDDGTIRIECKVKQESAESSRLSFTVSDTGIGIPKDRIEHLFDPYVQADLSMVKQKGGTGLGLAICKRIIQALGGDISCESELDKGTSFHFHFPCRLASKDQLLPEEIQAQDMRQAATLDKPERPLRILCADDEPENRAVLRELLETLGHQVSMVKNGREIIDTLRSEEFDILLTDIQMPRISGLEACRKIRQGEVSDKTKDLYIVGLTGFAMSGDREKCLEVGMNDYIAKPLRLNLLQSTIQKASKILG